MNNGAIHQHPLFRLLDRPVSEEDLNTSTALVSAPRVNTEANMAAVFIFRVATEWVALPATMVVEIIEQRLFHRLPHRSNDVVLGLVNVRGRLLPLVSAAAFLNTGRSAQTAPDDSLALRIVVIHEEATRLALPVHEVHGIHRFSPSEVLQPPLTLAAAGHITGIFSWNGKTVGQIDPKLLMEFFKRYLA